MLLNISASYSGPFAGIPDWVIAVEVIGLVLNIVCMIVCPMVAASKNRSVVGWFFGGLILSVIGLIIVLLLPEAFGEYRHTPNGSNYLAKETPGALINCPACGRRISKSAKACPHCGHPINE